MSNESSFRSLLGDGGAQSDTVGGQVKNFQQEFDKHCALTKKQRMYGFGICFIGGWCLAVGGLLALGSPAIFAVLYTLGNVMALAATCFLFGPVAQCKNMFKPIRVGATIIYLITIGSTLAFVFAFDPPIGALVLLSLAVQFCAMVWYAASYIPYGRAMIKKMLGGVCKSVANDA